MGVFSAIVGILSVLLVLAEYFLVNYGQCQVTINDQKELSVTGGCTLLSALYENKIFIPSACGGQATCGFCKVTVLNGGGPFLPTEAEFVGRAERREGVRLACQVKVKEDIQIKVPPEYLDVQEFSAEVLSTRDVTPDIKELRFGLIEPKEIEFRPGQYIQIKAPDPDGGFVFRAYSIASATYDKNIVELNVRIVPGGIGSTYLHNLKVGDKVTFTGPFGEFELNEDENCEIICVGGGCGMAPMRAIIRSIYEKNPNRKCWLFFGCRGSDDIFYLDDYQEMEKKYPGFHVVYGLSDMKEGDVWDGEKGFIHLSVDKYLDDEEKPRQAFLCGPPPMIAAVMDVLEDKGLDEEDIFYDKF
ncbi:MAG: 2Fe-2S iron-sulfur cluster binding domain-containing protein [Planctomycetes bacterium]|nr:2Fe-2S iron-sulfur cluster binding domain-containing protein [Planctomycetota bacterium]